MDGKNILFTGPPRCGKSTLIEKIIERMERPVTGFFTRELREKNRRVGFSINTIDGREGLLAHVEKKSRYRVGKYGVNLEDINRVVVPSMIPKRKGEIVVIDEIGKMECFYPLFRETLFDTLESDHHVIGTISSAGSVFIREVKARNDVWLVEVTVQNRNELVKEYRHLYSN